MDDNEPIQLPSSTRPARVEIIPSSASTSSLDATLHPGTTVTHHRARTNSETSLSKTLEFYNIPPSRLSSTSSLHLVSTGRASPALLQSTSTFTGVTPTPRGPSPAPTHSASILPSSSFFRPKQPSTAAASASTERSSRIGNGPLITRISSEYATKDEKLSTRRMSGDIEEDLNEPKELSRRGSGSSSRPASPFGFGAEGPRHPIASGLGVFGTGTRSTSISPNEPATSTSGINRRSLSATSHTTSTVRRESSEAAAVEAGGGPKSKESREPLIDFPASPGLLRPDRSPKTQHNRKLSDDTKFDVHRTSISIRNGVEEVVQRARNSFSVVAGGGGRNNFDAGGVGGKPVGAHLLHEVSPSDKGPPVTTIPLEKIRNEKGRPLKNYQLHEGGNRFFLSGRLVSSSDSPVPFIICLILAILLPVLFFVFNSNFLWTHLGGSGKASLFVFAWLGAIMITNMFKTAFRDPGIIPRGLDKVPERKWIPDLNGEGEGGWRAEPRYMRLREGVIASKWCNTCATYRPPRTSHCRLCDNCVDHTDHHCTFLNNCIGRRNYTSFIAFLVFSILCAIYAIAFSSYHIYRNHLELPSRWATEWDTVGSFVVAILSFCLVLPILSLFGYHVRLLWTNHTTIEMLRPKDVRSGAIDPSSGKTLGNLYALRSPMDNIVSLLCRPIAVESWVKPWGFATRDERYAGGTFEKEES